MLGRARSVRCRSYSDACPSTNSQGREATMGKSKTSDAAKQLSRLGAQKGGRARANVLTDEERSEIARNASRARWGKAGKVIAEREEPDVREEEAEESHTPVVVELPFSMYPGTLQLGDAIVEVHVLNDGRRVIAQREVVKALRGTETAPTSLTRYLERLPTSDMAKIASRTIQFRIPNLPSSAIGYEAELLIEICDMYLRARDEDLLRPSQLGLAARAEIIVRACAKVGITALIDEATGYQKVRANRALQIKLQAFIAEEMQEWVRTFPEEFWHELARLEGIRYSPRHRPLRWGKYVMRFVYDSIDPDIGKKLREINANPRFRQNHHQWLREYGRDKLHRQLGGVIAIMRECKDMDEFRLRFSRVFDKNPQLSFDIDWDELNKAA
jgi:hypothetical protein